MKKTFLLLVFITTLSFTLSGCTEETSNPAENEVQYIFEHSFSSDLFQFNLILKQLANVEDQEDYTYAEGMIDLFLARQLESIKTRIKRTSSYNDMVDPSLQDDVDELQRSIPEYLERVKDAADQNFEYVLEEKETFKEIRALERKINGERLDTVESANDLEPKMKELVELLKQEEEE